MGLLGIIDRRNDGQVEWYFKLEKMCRKLCPVGDSVRRFAGRGGGEGEHIADRGNGKQFSLLFFLARFLRERLEFRVEARDVDLKDSFTRVL